MRYSCVLELNDALLSDLQRLREVCGNSVECIVGADVGIEDDFEAVCGSLELFWDLGRGEGDDVQELVVVDDGRWVHHRSRRQESGTRV